MTVRVVTPALPILSVEEVKQQVRIETDETEEEAYLSSLVAAAQAWIDGPDGWLERSVGVQELEWSLSAWPNGDCFRLPFGPEIEIVSVTYTDPDGDEQVWPFPTPLYFEDMPSVRGRDGDIRIRYWAGYGRRNPDAGPEGQPDWLMDIPASIKHAMLLLIGQWYQSRAAVRIGEAVNALPFGVEALLQPFRVYD